MIPRSQPNRIIGSFLDTEIALRCPHHTAHNSNVLHRRLCATVEAVGAVIARPEPPAPQQSPRRGGDESTSRCGPLAGPAGSTDEAKKNRILSNRQKYKKSNTDAPGGAVIFSVFEMKRTRAVYKTRKLVLQARSCTRIVISLSYA